MVYDSKGIVNHINLDKVEPQLLPEGVSVHAAFRDHTVSS